MAGEELGAQMPYKVTFPDGYVQKFTAPSGMAREDIKQRAIQERSIAEGKIATSPPRTMDVAPDARVPMTGTAIAASGPAMSGLTTGAAELATNPNVPKYAATAGRIIGGAAPVVGGASEFGLPGALMGVAGAAKGAWAGGKTGWFTGKLAQSMARPAARGLAAAEPYVGALAPIVGGAQGALDVAQMAEPKRQDIGTFGVGASVSNDEVMDILKKKAAAGDRNAKRSLAYLQSLQPRPTP